MVHEKSEPPEIDRFITFNVPGPSMCWCVKGWLGGVVVIGRRTRDRVSSIEQAADLLCAQANSASYPQQDGK